MTAGLFSLRRFILSLLANSLTVFAGKLDDRIFEVGKHFCIP